MSPPINPVLVKELRQSVRNRYVLAAYLLFLLGLLVIIGLMVAGWLRDKGFGQEDNSLGLTLFHTVYGIVTTVAVLFIPTYVAIRLMRERWGNNLDLQFSTTIRPSALAWGKVWSGLAVAGLLMSGAVPFMAFSHLLRGIDLPSIFLCVVVALGALVLLIQAAVLYAAFPAPKLVRALVGGLTAFLLIPLCVWLNMGASELVSSGFAATLGTAESWRVVGLGCAAWATAVLGLHAFAVAALSPPSADRMRPVRVVATLLWALWGVGLAIATRVTSDPDYVEFWAGFSLLALAGFAVQATSERTVPGRRVLAKTPASLPRRLLAFLFTTGQVQGLSWTLLLLGATLTLYRAAAGSTKSFANDFDELVAFVLVVVGYALTVTLAWRYVFRRVMASEALWVATLILILAGGIVPNLFALFSSGRDEAWVFGNIFEVDDMDALPWAFGWVIVAIALFAPTIARTFTAYRRPPPAKVG